MARKRFEIPRVLFVNGYRIRLRGGLGGLMPTKGLLKDLEAHHFHGNPWSGFWIKEFVVRTVVETEEEGGGVYARYDVEMVSQRAAVG